MVIAPSATAFDGGGDDATEICRDRSLVLAHRGGDSAAFTAIVHAHHAGLLRQARRQLGDTCDAEDAVQETLLRAYRGLGRFGAGGDWRLGAWLARIMTNVCADQRTRRQASTKLATRMHHEERAAADTGELASDPVALAAVHQAMAQLPTSQRQAFVLRAVDDLSYHAIAEQLGISEDNARARVQRARAALRRTLERTAALGAVPAAAWESMRSSLPPRRRASLRAPRSPAGRSSLRSLVLRGHLRDMATSSGSSARGAAATSTAGATSSSALPAASGAASGSCGALPAASSSVPGVPGASSALAVSPGAVSSGALSSGALSSGALSSGALPMSSGAASGAANVASTASGALSASSPLSSATQLANQLAGQMAASPAGQVLLASASGGAGGGRGALVLGLAASVATAGALSFPTSSLPSSQAAARFHPALVQGPGSLAGAPATSGSATSGSATSDSATSGSATAPVGGSGGGSSPDTSSSGTGSVSSAGDSTGSGTPSGSSTATSGGPSTGTTTLPAWMTTALELAGGSFGTTHATSSSSSGLGGSGSSTTGSGSGSSTSMAAVLPPGTCTGVAGFPGATSQSPPKIVDGTVDQTLDTGRVDVSSAGFDPFFTAAAPLSGGGIGSRSASTASTTGGSGSRSAGGGSTSSGASSATAGGNGSASTSTSGSTSSGASSATAGGSGGASTTGSGATTSGTTSSSPGDAPLVQMAVGTCLATSGSVLAVDLTGPGGLQVQLVGSLLSASALEDPASSGLADGPGAPASGSGAAGTGTSSSTSEASASSSTTGTTTGDGAPSATSGGSGSPGTSSAAATGEPGTASSPPATTSSGASSAGTTTSSPAPSGAVYLFAGVVHLYGTDAVGSSLPWGLPDWFVARLRVERSPSTAVLDVAFVGPTAETSAAAPNSTTATATSAATSPDATGS